MIDFLYTIWYNRVGKWLLVNIESEIFKRGKIDFDKLLAYGFVRDNHGYHYSKKFMKNFQAQIFVDLKGNIQGKVYDLQMDDEYTNFRIENLTGFASLVREEYILILKDIARHVLTTESFIYPQSNRIANLIFEKYQVSPEFLWEKDPGYGVFRNGTSKKWFAVIMNVDKSKVINNLSGEIEIINLKLGNDVSFALEQNGVYPAYHMSKKSWVSIILDDTLSDEVIMKYVDMSFSFTNGSKAWIIPANPKYYDVISEFERTNLITWHQDAHIQVGDLVYIYLTKPYQAILFGCEVIEASISDYGAKQKSMKLKLFRKYNQNEFPLEKIKLYGVKSVRSARRIPLQLNQELERKN